MAFRTECPVRFAHVDPAGIVFYPRYFEMLNAAVEDWFAAMGADFATLHLSQKIGIPTVKLDVAFRAPSRLGDLLTIAIAAGNIGRSSCEFTAIFSCSGEERLRAEAVLVCVDLAVHRSIPWPAALRAEMEKFRDIEAPAA